MSSVQPEVSGQAVFVGGGEMGALMRSFDWSQTSLGSAEQWSQSLKTAVRIMLTSRQAMFVWWGEDLINLYNDAYRSILCGKHPEALGQPASQVWREIWDQVGPRAASAIRNNEGTYDEALLLIMERNGYPEETYYTFSYSPVPDVEGGPGGIICANTDDTQRIIGERQLALLKELASSTADARTFDEACTLSAACLATNPYDLPFGIIYLVDPEQQCAFLAGTSGIEAGHPITPPTITLDDPNWHFTEVLSTQQPYLVSELDPQFSDLPTGAWERSPHQFVIVPIAASGKTGKAGILVAGLNPFRLFDDNYQRFLNLVSAQIAASIANAQAYEEERKRAEALAELDRAKTTFFSNISHEFRTPLTLMLSPLEDLLATDGMLAEEPRQQLELVHRNSLRLLKLVNTLLDFSRIEAGRVQAVYEPTDLAAFTSELASVFRSAIEQAGLQFTVACEPLSEAVYVDREMWEKIVLNLLSNAFKFTFSGEIAVTLQQKARTVELIVRDTGIGVPADELPRLFERFHRVEGAQGRTQEGSGIGLALVQELIRLHGGQVQVESIEGKGTTFILTIPMGTEHLPVDRIQASRHATSTALGAAPYVEEALRWLPDSGNGTAQEWMPEAVPANSTAPIPLHLSVPSIATTRILLADDNADMRDYVKRLLSNQGYEVQTATDGIAALTAIQQEIPDLVLTDVMMPRLDGFGLLQELRSSPMTREIPIILLSARAGEEARVEGLAAGADDYLTKPFSARELLARVEASLKLAQLRREAQQREQSLRLDAEAAQQRVETILSSINDGFYTLDLDWRYTYVNDRLSSITQMPRETMLGQCIWDLFPETVDTELYQTFHQAFHEQSAIDFEYFYPTWNRWYEHRIYPSSDGLTVFCADITARKQAEKAVRESERRFRRLVESNMFGVGFGDFTGGIHYVNDYFLNMVGYSREDLATGQLRWTEITPPELLPLDEKAMQELKTKGVATPFEKEYIRKDGSRVPILIGSALLQEPYDQQQEIIAFLIDLTERKQAEAERERLLQQAQTAREEAETANRIKDEFLAVLSHELRSPLNPILGWAKLLQKGNLDREASRRALATIERNAKLQTQLIEDLLDVSRILRGKMSLNIYPVNLMTVIESALETVRLAAEAKQIQIRTVVTLKQGQVSGDAARLQQIVWNLLSNAVKFTPDGGHVEIRLEQVRNYAQIQVRDTGIGISPDFLPYVFDYFRQEDGKITRKFGGLGLGLAIVRHLTELHGGSIHATSLGEGQGATFTVQLPLLSSPPASDTSDETADALIDFSQLQILIVDDEPDMRDLIQVILEEQGARVNIAASADEALMFFEHQCPDLLISDIGMPDVDGYMLMQQIRRRSPEQGKFVPAIALTAYAGEYDQKQAINAGFQCHIAKPVEPEVLVKTIATLVNSGTALSE